MKKFLLSIIGSIVLTTFLACGGGGGGSGGTGTAVSPSTSLDLSNVNQIMLAPTGLTSTTFSQIKNIFQATIFASLGIFNAYASTSTANQVYSVDSIGTINSINVANVVSGSSNNPATSTFMLNSSKYLFIGYDQLYQSKAGSSNSKQCVIVGIRKTDGKFSCIGSNPRCDSNNVCNVDVYNSQIKINPNGDVLFVVLGEGGLNKIDLKDPENSVETSVFTHSNLGDASFPIINSNDDVMVTINLNGSSSNVITKIFSSNGQIHTIPGSDQLNHISCSFAGAGSYSSNFYYVHLDSTSSLFNYIKLSRNADGTFTSNIMYTENVGSGVLGANCTNIVHLGDRIFGLNWYNSNNPTFPGNSVLMEYPSSSGSIQHYQLSSSFPIKKDLQAYSGGVAILGMTADGLSTGIERFDAQTNTVSTVLGSGEYLIKSMTVSSNGDISFVGKRILDNVNIIGKISESSNSLTKSVLSVESSAIASIKILSGWSN